MRAVEEHVTTQRATLSYEDRDAFREVCGPNDDHLKLVEELLGVSLSSLDGRATCLMALRLVDLEAY